PSTKRACSSRRPSPSTRRGRASRGRRAPSRATATRGGPFGPPQGRARGAPPPPAPAPPRATPPTSGRGGAPARPPAPPGGGGRLFAGGGRGGRGGGGPGDGPQGRGGGAPAPQGRAAAAAAPRLPDRLLPLPADGLARRGARQGPGAGSDRRRFAHRALDRR